FRALPGEPLPPTPLGAAALVNGPPSDAVTRTRVLAPVPDAPRRPNRRTAVIVASVLAVLLAAGGITAAVALNTPSAASDPGL
ncbi:hypothetical protein ACSTH8_00305, partial [Vibrio parahaemolyticus]